MPHRPVALGLMLLSFVGCASDGVVHVAPDESRPHISWEIRAGGADGDADFVCGSAQRSKPCVLPASTEKSRALATVHLFIHAAAQPVSYLGFMRVPFFGGNGERKLGEVNITVKPGSRPVSSTVVGQVTLKPGDYTLTIAIDAIQPGAPNPVHISEQAPVAVK
jgi:hypothetical protein